MSVVCCRHCTQPCCRDRLTDECHCHACRGKEVAKCADVLWEVLKPPPHATPTEASSARCMVAQALVKQFEGGALAYGCTRAHCGAAVTQRDVLDELRREPEPRSKLSSFYYTWVTEHEDCVGERESCPLGSHLHTHACQMEGEYMCFRRGRAQARLAQADAVTGDPEIEYVGSASESDE